MTDQKTPPRVSSEPVAVPPPADDVDRDRDTAEDVTDRVPGDALEDRGTFDDPVLSGERNDPDDLTAVSPGAPEYHDPAPQETAFGAATVGGAAAAAAQAGPSREVRDRDEADGAIDDRDVNRDLDSDRDLDGDLDGDRDLDGNRDLDRTTALDADRAAEDRAYEDRAYEDTVDGSHDDTVDRTYDDAADQGHLAVDAEADAHHDEPLGGPSDLAEATPAVDAPAETAHETAVEEPIAGLWGEQTVQGYRDRWREVQLRFVDDPPAAAREANLLVEEAVGALTAELSRQKEQLSGWSGEDTEDLRAVVRRHRDFLDRLLGL